MLRATVHTVKPDREAGRSEFGLGPRRTNHPGRTKTMEARAKRRSGFRIGRGAVDVEAVGNPEQDCEAAPRIGNQRNFGK